jgi:hypothetical protein
MKLGTQTGSVINHLYAAGTKGQPEPVVGMGATILHWTDRSAGTIVAVETDKQGRYVVKVQGDHWKIISGTEQNGSAAYEYSPNPKGGISTFRFEDGRWCELRLNRDSGRLNKVARGNGNGLTIGRRDRYYDPSF